MADVHREVRRIPQGEEEEQFPLILRTIGNLEVVVNAPFETLEASVNTLRNWLIGVGSALGILNIVLHLLP